MAALIRLKMTCMPEYMRINAVNWAIEGFQMFGLSDKHLIEAHIRQRFEANYTGDWEVLIGRGRGGLQFKYRFITFLANGVEVVIYQKPGPE